MFKKYIFLTVLFCVSRFGYVSSMAQGGLTGVQVSDLMAQERFNAYQEFEKYHGETEDSFELDNQTFFDKTVSAAELVEWFNKKETPEQNQNFNDFYKDFMSKNHKSEVDVSQAHTDQESSIFSLN